MWLVLTLVVLHFCVFYQLDAIGLTGPDEPRYAAIAREMAESGDWITPRLHGTPWFEKPALYYWDAALRYQIWGDTEFSARSPSAGAATATALVLGWLASQIYGWQAAAVVMLLFPTTVAVIGFGRAATTDMLFAASLAMAMT
ncbi:MAG: ArnT family glycosyltransferase, partial [Candidatus Acidiferrales bacterium]